MENLATKDEDTREALLRQLRTTRQRADMAHVVGVEHSVSASARCVDGHFLEGHYRTSARDVEIVAEELLDCDENGCRTYQVDARRDAPLPFDLDVFVVCSE